jgi:hypothetical protein
LNGIQEVGGSTPLGSTNKIKELASECLDLVTPCDDRR